MARNGVRVAAATAKDKLRKALAVGLTGNGARGIGFSAEKANTCTLQEHGITAEEALRNNRLPDQYSPQLSLFVLAAGVRLLNESKADRRT